MGKLIRDTDKQKFFMLKEQIQMESNLEVSDPGSYPDVRTQAHRASSEWTGKRPLALGADQGYGVTNRKSDQKGRRDAGSSPQWVSVTDTELRTGLEGAVYSQV